MPRITARDVTHQRGGGGEIFTDFVDTLIRTQGYASSVPYSNIRTNLRANVSDGGVDTQVDTPFIGDPTGYFSYPTIWQYKAVEYKTITKPKLRKEINKTYAKECIAHGFAYRLCICDDLTVKKQNEWENYLTRLCREINPDAPEAKVITSSSLANWCNKFPGLIFRFLSIDIDSLHFHAWGINITSETHTYVPIPTWEPYREAIKRHINISGECIEVVLPLQGEAGVGKTRLVYEALKETEGAEGLVLYTQDEQSAQRIATMLANDASVYAILIADECSLGDRMRLGELLQGHRQRIRVISIDNSGERPPTGSPEHWLGKVPSDHLDSILERNFPSVPADRRSAYASLSGGYIRLAIDMCGHDGNIARAGHVGPAIPTIQAYFHNRLSNQERGIVEALSLLVKVGYKDDVSTELDHLCTLTSLSRHEIETVVNRMHNSSGFIARAGRYLYVSPEIISQIAFDGAWRRWIEPDPNSFLLRVTDAILENFIKRVARSATEEARRIVGDFFFEWAEHLTSGELATLSTVDRLVALVDTEPDTYFPYLRNIIENADLGQLMAVTGRGIGGRWGPRRSLVWLAERMAAFPEYFDNAAEILLKFALAESEPGIGNNATEIWKQLFRITLSGTAIPFLDRIKKLEERIFSIDEQTSNLALDALMGTIVFGGMRTVGWTVIAGRIPPQEWSPKNNAELKTCRDNIVALLYKLSKSNILRLSEKAQGIVIKHLRILLIYGYLPELINIFPSDSISEDIRLQVIKAIENFLYYEGRQNSPRPKPHPEYIKDVRHWLETLKPNDTHGRLATAIGVDSWYYSMRGKEDVWQKEIRALAQQLYSDQDVLKKELEWLYSQYAKSAFILGQEIGKIDSTGVLLEFLITSSLRYKAYSLTGGYIRGLMNNYPTYQERLNKLLDKIEEESPMLAYELCMSGGKATQDIERTFRLIDSGKLPVIYLTGFFIGISARLLSKNEFEGILHRFIQGIRQKEKSVHETALQFVEYYLNSIQPEERILIFQDQNILSLLWSIVEIHIKEYSEGLYYWGQVLHALVSVDPDRATQIAAPYLISDDIVTQEEATNILQNIASTYPEIVMKRLGEIILDKDRGWHFFIGKYTNLIQSLPPDIVMSWIKSYGVEAARRLARHVPSPYTDETGNPIVPPLTEFILKSFEDDDRTFHEFCAGVHTNQTYTGNIAAQFNQEAEVAKKFLSHPLKRIREWANLEIQAARREAKQWQQIDEELKIE